MALLARLLLAPLASLGVAATLPTDAPSPVRAELEVLAGSSASFCGAVRLGASRAEANACSRAALAARTPFWVAFQQQGTDSFVWEGAALDSEGNSWALFYDSDVSGGGSAGSRLGVSQCSRLRFARSGDPAVVCVELERDP